MKLQDVLIRYSVDNLKNLNRLCDSASNGGKKQLVQQICAALTEQDSLRRLWNKLDDLSKKAVTAAYYNGGIFNPEQFQAQYQALPTRQSRRGSWTHQYEPLRLDLFLYTTSIASPFYYASYNDHFQWIIPHDLQPLLTTIIPAQERFQIEGVPEAPKQVPGKQGKLFDLQGSETEQIGQHDLLAYLRLVDQKKIKPSSTNKLTLSGVKLILANLLNDDFLPLSEKIRAVDAIRPSGLDAFARSSGLVEGRYDALDLTAKGREFYRTQEPELLLEAFEYWTEKGQFDELSRLVGIKGQTSRKTRLTRPAVRREQIIEALSWCPVGVWIDIEQFYRAIKVWRFDFEVETTRDSQLRAGSSHLYYSSESYWYLVKGAYINAVIWEMLGSLGAVDLLYLPPEQSALTSTHHYLSSSISLYDGLKFFRINNLGAYLLGQAYEYLPSMPLKPATFTVSADLILTMTDPSTITPNITSHLEQIGQPLAEHRYQLDIQRVLVALEAGASLAYIDKFLRAHHEGPLPDNLTTWLEKIRQNSQAIKLISPALLMNVHTTELASKLIADPKLKPFCRLVDDKTLVIPTSKRKLFQTRLRELEYVLL